MSKETRAYKALKKLHPDSHSTRIETWAGIGIFDANFCKNGVEIWVECKQTTRPKKKSIPIKAKIRPSQIAWEYERRAAGGRTYVALFVESELYLLPGKYIKDLVAGIEQHILENIQTSPLNIFNK